MLFFRAKSAKPWTISKVYTCPHSLRGAVFGAMSSAIVAACQPEPAPTSRTLRPASNCRASFIIETMFRLAGNNVPAMWRRSRLPEADRQRRIHCTVRSNVLRQELPPGHLAHRLNNLGRPQHAFPAQTLNQLFP